MGIESQYVVKIGSKGEIFPPKEVRDYLKLESGQSVLLKVYPNRIIIHKVESLEEILKKPSDVKVSYHVLNNLESDFE